MNVQAVRCLVVANHAGRMVSGFTMRRIDVVVSRRQT
jgi:hypothetical protein